MSFFIRLCSRRRRAYHLGAVGETLHKLRGQRFEKVHPRQKSSRLHFRVLMASTILTEHLRRPLEHENVVRTTHLSRIVFFKALPPLNLLLNFFASISAHFLRIPSHFLQYFFASAPQIKICSVSTKQLTFEATICFRTQFRWQPSDLQVELRSGNQFTQSQEVQC